MGRAGPEVAAAIARSPRSRLAPLAAAAPAMCAAAALRSVYAFSARPLAGGEPVSLSSLRGKVLLIENVASL
ncbi:hypothetical protein MC885_002535 [Smutsia gigantea]|nr:hypothetical protein MC885_002535 [Smutsia gigantea]